MSTVQTIRVCSGLTDSCKTFSPRKGLALGSARGRIPDVSSYQGHPNWSAAKASGIAGAIVKAGEYVADPDAAWNAAQLRALHVWYAIYWFVRNTGCSHESAQIIASAHALHSLLVVNDLEVREAAGYGACLVPAERRAGLIPVDYTSPGSWPGGAGFGGSPLWQAEYGPVLHPFWKPVVAWQCTDGQIGCVTYVPGIGLDDVSANLGITKLGVVPPPSPKWTYKRAFNVGYRRGYDVRWLELRHRRVPPFVAGFPKQFWPVVSYGFSLGFRAAR